MFAADPRIVLELCADERVAGLRLDHIDGLLDPAGYSSSAEAIAAGGRNRPAVLVVEDPDRDEVLDARLPVDGTTGYEFADRAGGLLLSEKGCRELFAFGAAFTGEHVSFGDLGLTGKIQMLERTFEAQLDGVARLALSALDTEHPGHDLSLADVRRAVAELSSFLDVYRTYFAGGPPTRVDVDTIRRSVARRDPRPSTRRWNGHSDWWRTASWKAGATGAHGSAWPAAGSSSRVP